MVVAALAPSPTMTAVSTALLPLPFWPLMNVILLLRSNLRCSWHIKFFNVMFLIRPGGCGWGTVRFINH